MNLFATLCFAHLGILMGAQGWLAEVCLDDGDPIMRQIPLSPGNFFIDLMHPCNPDTLLTQITFKKWPNEQYFF